MPSPPCHPESTPRSAPDWPHARRRINSRSVRRGIMRRRTLLLGTSAALCFEGCAHARSDIDASASPIVSAVAGTGPSVAVVEYRGSTFRFDETTGQDLGDYIDPVGQFRQRCLRVEHDRLPLTVFFRPDRDSNRTEVVFELGQPQPPAPQPISTLTVQASSAADIGIYGRDPPSLLVCAMVLAVRTASRSREGRKPHCCPPAAAIRCIGPRPLQQGQ